MKKHTIFSQGLLLGGDDFTGASERKETQLWLGESAFSVKLRGSYLPNCINQENRIDNFK